MTMMVAMEADTAALATIHFALIKTASHYIPFELNLLFVLLVAIYCYSSDCSRWLFELKYATEKEMRRNAFSELLFFVAKIKWGFQYSIKKSVIKCFLFCGGGGHQIESHEWK